MTAPVEVAPGLHHPLPGAEDFTRLAEALGLTALEIHGGYRLRTTEWGHVDLMLQMFNWRITDTEHVREGAPEWTAGYRRGWCYPKEAGMLQILVCAARWDGSPDTEPSGWIRAIDTMEVRAVLGRERRDGEPLAGVEQQ